VREAAGRTPAEAAEMVELVRRAGIDRGYAETEVFAPSVVRVRELIESGALGNVLTVRSREEAVFAWGATLVHGERTHGEDNAVFLVRFAGKRAAACETSWTVQGGMELRNEVYNVVARVTADTRQSNVVAFTSAEAGHVVEKADVQAGRANLVTEELYGYHGEMRHFVECAAAGTMPRETFVDGYVVNAVIDAAYPLDAVGTMGRCFPRC
jgi:predicted dehydrogenase